MRRQRVIFRSVLGQLRTLTQVYRAYGLEGEPTCMMCGCGRETSVHTMGTCEGEDMKVARLDARRKVEGVMRKHLGHTALVGCIDATCDILTCHAQNY